MFSLEENDWRDLLHQQNKLDNIIYKNLNIDRSKIISKKILALYVEFSEFLNETKAFKYWSKKNYNFEMLHEELIDVLHFLLSIINDLNIDIFNFKLNKNLHLKYKNNTIALLYEAINWLNQFCYKKNSESLFIFLNYYFAIVFHYNIKKNNFLKLYNKKNLINIERQKNNY